MAVLLSLSLCLLFLLLSSAGGQSGGGKTSSEAAKDGDKLPAAGDVTPVNNSDDNDTPTDPGPPTNDTEPTTEPTTGSEE